VTEVGDIFIYGITVARIIRLAVSVHGRKLLTINDKGGKYPPFLIRESRRQTKITEYFRKQ
jgi:hypothetical protein